MAEKKKEICINCGSEMNHHADKVVFDVSKDDLEFYDDTYEGKLEEHHKCPVCGENYSKPIKES